MVRAFWGLGVECAMDAAYEKEKGQEKVWGRPTLELAGKSKPGAKYEYKYPAKNNWHKSDSTPGDATGKGN